MFRPRNMHWALLTLNEPKVNIAVEGSSGVAFYSAITGSMSHAADTLML